MKIRRQAIIWIVAYLLLILSPWLVLLLAPRPASREFLRELSVWLGFLGLSLMGLQFIPTARLPFLAQVFPMDKLYAFHHTTSIAAFVLALAHPLLLFVNNPYTLRLLNVFTAPARAQAAVLAVLLLIVLIVTSVWRQQVRLNYDHWRVLHDLLAIAISGLALFHIFRVNYYTAVPAQRVLWIVQAVIWGAMILYVRVLKPYLMMRRPYEVVEVRAERGDVWTLVLRPVGHPGIPFHAGQVAWITVGRSPFAFREHPFSYTSSAERTDIVEFGIKELGDFTSTIKDLKPGERVYIDGPYGNFDIDHFSGSSYVFIAGGIGIAPILSMLRTLRDRGEVHPLTLFYGNRDWDSIAYREEIATYEETLGLKVIHVLERPPEGWEGETGYLNKAILERHLPPECRECIYFICGPLPMIDAVEKALAELQVPKSQLLDFVQNILAGRVHSERYEMA